MAGKKKDPPKGKRAKSKKPGRAGTEDLNMQERGAERRVAQLRNKLTDAMQDPLMRDQIVRAIRAMMRGE